MRPLLTVVMMVFALCGSGQAALIAEVRTSMGDFSIDLNYTGARRTVSHFMRLAEGEQPWIDEKTGEIRTGTPFYTGLKFYKKVNTGNHKYIQAGARYPDDPNIPVSNVNQGAGYVIRDEIRRNSYGQMQVPHGLYTVSMANTGPHSSSSQFFINLMADSSWNDRNSAFGTVQQNFIEYPDTGSPYVSYNGRAVVNAILTSSNDVTINSITFRITNNTPTEFDSSDYATELPVISKRQIWSLTYTPTDVSLHFQPMAQAGVTRVLVSADLLTWYPFPTVTTFTPGDQGATIALGDLGVPKAFFKSTLVSYPHSTMPDDLNGNTIRIALGKPYASPESREVQLFFDTHAIEHVYYAYATDSSGTFTYTLTPKGPYHADLEVTFDGAVTETYRLYFGGADLDISEDEQMHAIIDPVGAAPVEARWYYVP